MTKKNNIKDTIAILVYCVENKISLYTYCEIHNINSDTLVDYIQVHKYIDKSLAFAYRTYTISGVHRADTKGSFAREICLTPKGWIAIAISSDDKSLALYAHNRFNK